MIQIYYNKKTPGSFAMPQIFQFCINTAIMRRLCFAIIQRDFCDMIDNKQYHLERTLSWCMNTESSVKRYNN